ncbi:histidine phosphotransferase family protein [Paracoccus alkanivorans]|uniref:Histidine phosphotransferase n=1 Tax=Paracoccus alkanivorans TaxID=2116655 RepID=A0A3M0M913_9RHOB|nr:histidine phosphotransferase family protein [Paracoccus alkanivorans]RMC33815.1 histidine phosphotransferase [Paracoccus alkanivorans]
MSAHTMRIDPRQLAALVGSRLCHDLVSPLGAIGNGIELLELSDEFPGLTKTPEMRLIAESVNAAHSRIQAFRVAFGHAGKDQQVTRAELARLIEGMTGQSRLRAELTAYGTFPRPEIRMIVLAMMCLEHALPRGGKVSILHSSSGWRLLAQGEQTRPDPALWSWLDSCDTASRRTPAPSEVQFALLAEAATELERRLRWKMTDRNAEIAF